VNSAIAFVPLPELEIGKLPERLNPLLAVFGNVNAAVVPPAKLDRWGRV